MSKSSINNDNLGNIERNTVFLSRTLQKVAMKIGPNEKVIRKSKRYALEPKSNVPNRRFTEEEVRKIRTMKVSEAMIAFGLSKGGAKLIISGENYAWVF